MDVVGSWTFESAEKAGTNDIPGWFLGQVAFFSFALFYLPTVSVTVKISVINSSDKKIKKISIFLRNSSETRAIGQYFVCTLAVSSWHKHILYDWQEFHERFQWEVIWFRRRRTFWTEPLYENNFPLHNHQAGINSRSIPPIASRFWHFHGKITQEVCTRLLN